MHSWMTSVHENTPQKETDEIPTLDLFKSHNVEFRGLIGGPRLDPRYVQDQI